LLLCSDLLDADWQAGLQSLLSRRFEITLLHTLAPQEIEPELDGDIRLVDSEGGPPVDLTADVDVLRRYQQQLAAWRDEVADFCNGRGIAYVPVETNLPLEDLLFNLLRRRGVVR
jgi:hypothetical protein